MADAEDLEVLTFLRKKQELSEVYRKKEYVVVRHAADGNTQEVTIEILDAGPDFGDPNLRFQCKATAADGRSTTGNTAETAKAALSLLHWSELDR